jgi:hypothetical protein
MIKEKFYKRIIKGLKLNDSPDQIFLFLNKNID